MAHSLNSEEDHTPFTVTCFLQELWHKSASTSDFELELQSEHLEFMVFLGLSFKISVLVMSCSSLPSNISLVTFAFTFLNLHSNRTR